MIRLFLDDLRNPPDDTWTVCRTADEAKALLLAGPVDIASLDHDLGECDACTAARSDGEAPRNTCLHQLTGYQLVVWMAEHDLWPRNKPAVHIANPVGRAAMIQAIERYWHAPKEPT